MPTNTPTCLKMPDRDLCGDLRNDPVRELAPFEWPDVVCSASNAHLRLYVAGWMLGDVRAALQLYERAGPDLLNRPGRLTTEGISAEVFSLVSLDS